MRYSLLGDSGLKVSKLCLGTMTFGEQNTEAEAHRQLDVAVDAGVNFIDTAEMYPIPPRSDTQGLTERYIGSWLKRSRMRERLIVASKVTGPIPSMPYLRGGPQLDRQQLAQALDESLARLCVDTIDLYQIHWPARKTNNFGRLGYEPAESTSTPLEETLETIAGFVAQGKVRHIGVSNETPWGVARYLHLADRRGWPRIVSIQNPYSLLNRSFEIGLAEFAHRERVGLIAYSPLGFGVLTGKYLQRTTPPGSRLTLYPHYNRYSSPQAAAVTERYAALAKAAGMAPAQLALAFVNSRPFTTSTVIGATNLSQLRENLASADLDLGPDLIAAVEALHNTQPNPSP